MAVNRLSILLLVAASSIALPRVGNDNSFNQLPARDSSAPAPPPPPPLPTSAVPSIPPTAPPAIPATQPPVALSTIPPAVAPSAIPSGALSTASAEAPVPTQSSVACDYEYCDGISSWCFYWAGVTGYDPLQGPLPGETRSPLGLCNTAVPSVL